MPALDDPLAPHERQIEERFVRASGPGGQNVNKVATAVELRFDVGASSLPPQVKARLIALAGNRMTTEGVLLIDGREHRTQAQNREAARARLAALLQLAAVRPQDAQADQARQSGKGAAPDLEEAARRREEPAGAARFRVVNASQEPPLLIAFAAPSSLLRETHRASMLPIVGNGPPGTFVVFPGGLRVSLPTDQIVSADDADGYARVGFGGMRWVGVDGDVLVFVRERELHPTAELSPERSHTMYLELGWVGVVSVDGQPVWPRRP